MKKTKEPSNKGIKTSQPNFTVDWFSQHIINWTAHLTKFKDKPVNFLEIGSYEGRSALWLMENILTNPKSTLTCVDLWEDYPESERLGFTVNGKLDLFKSNLSDYLDRIKIHQGSSFEIIPKLTGMYDMIYVDGDHTITGCWTDAINCFPKLNLGGIMIFDDYGWAINEGTDKHPKEAIERFLNEYQDKINVLSVGYQVIIERCSP